ncbi:E3 ubiquitin-protein ligase SHPRH isoform X2 [Dermacentor andersoni]|uniref:E3 ubiquitin-protein ligase SHPRH isoform X2 n=1 Tax=Dermacentor andersoni TaxID=34620 RepID=UPI0024163BC4|nr:E3 ubiquitin-protein ligase SHPRH-like isoform X3 [Dermacentor andersoni]
MSSRRKGTAPRRLGVQEDNAARCGQSGALQRLASGSFTIDESGGNDSCLPAPAKKRKSRSKKLLLDQELESLLEGCDYALQVERQDEHADCIMFCLGQVQLTAHPVSDGRRLEDALKRSYRLFIGCKTEQTDCRVVYNCSDQWLCFDATLLADEGVRLILSHRKSVFLEVAKVEDYCIVLDVLLSPTNVYHLSHASDSPRNSVNWEVQTLVHHFFGISHTSRHIETEKFRRQDFDLLYARIAAAQSLHPAADEDVNDVQHAALRPTLRPYQKEVVRWMLKREQPLAEISVDNFLYMPLVDCYGKVLYYNKYAGFFVEKKMDFVGTATPGGILADEMGLGKTVELLACILLHPMPIYDQTLAGASDTEEYELSDDDGHCAEGLADLPVATRVECLCGGLALGTDIEEVVCCPDCRVYHHLACTTSGGLRTGEKYLCPHCWVDSAKEKIRVKTTLIVSPSSISFQWLEEIERHQKDDRLHVMEYRGVQSHGFVSPPTFANYDIVLTTYEVLKKELNFTDLPHANSTNGRSFRKPRKFLPTPCPLTALMWWRICLDEAQMVEGTATKAAQMALKLSAVNRWCVTGTPIQKNLHDMYGLLLFLNEEPYNVKLWWNECLLLPYCHGDTDPLVTVLSRCFKRTMKRNVLEQIGVPPQESILHTLTFSPVEEVFYERQADRCASLFRQQVCKFPDHSIRIEQLDRHSVGLLLQPLVRLRQACCHPRAVRGAFLPMRTDSLTMDELLASLIKKTTVECEEAHRRMVSAMNGIAGIHIIRDERREAADAYREVLWSVKDHSRNIKTDRLQQLHALHNLAQLLDACRTEGVMPLDHSGECLQSSQDTKIQLDFVTRLSTSTAGTCASTLDSVQSAGDCGPRSLVPDRMGNTGICDSASEPSDGTANVSEPDVTSTMSVCTAGGDSYDPTSTLGSSELAHPASTVLDSTAITSSCNPESSAQSCSHSSMISSCAENAGCRDNPNVLPGGTVNTGNCGSARNPGLLDRTFCTSVPAVAWTEKTADLMKSTTSITPKVAYIPQAPIDDQLHEEAAKLRESYLEGYLTTIHATKKQFMQATQAVKETVNKFSLPKRQPWWSTLLNASMESNKDEWLVGKIKDDLEAKKSNVKSSSVTDQFNTAHGLQYVIDTQLRQLEAARENLLGTVKALSANPSADEVVSAVECHLRPSKKKRNKCNYCVVHELFNLYESRLFCFSEDAAHEEAQDKEDALFGALRRGNWGDSNLEKIIKSLSKSSFFAGDTALCSDGQVHVQLFAALKKEFRVPEQWSRLLHEKELHKNNLKKKLGQLFYLQNLAKAGSHRAGECNPEPCPICRNPLGTRWSVMQCGHNFCLDCIKMVCSTPSSMRSGSLLCAVCRSSCAHGDVFYVQTTPPSAPQSRFSLKGSHTTKIGGIVETILEIKADDPDAKALVFSSWSIVIDVLKKALEENEVSYIMLKPGPNFKNNLALFRHDPSIMVLLLPLSLGAKGLNLTEATHVLLVEPILNLGEELQAIGRVHRIGQTRKTYIHRFMVKNTIEERIVDFLKSSQTSRSCLEDHAKVTIDDLKNLFK